MRRPGAFVFGFVSLELWAVHGLYHLAQALGSPARLILDPLFRETPFGWTVHAGVELMLGCVTVAFLYLVAVE